MKSRAERIKIALADMHSAYCHLGNAHLQLLGIDEFKHVHDQVVACMKALNNCEHLVLLDPEAA